MFLGFSGSHSTWTGDGILLFFPLSREC